jgi:hypothetical protein
VSLWQSVDNRRRNGPPVDQIFDLVERVTTGGDSRILIVEKEVPERAHPKRSIEEWIKIS